MIVTEEESVCMGTRSYELCNPLRAITSQTALDDTESTHVERTAC
jgi:hypothetical protein